MESGEEARCYLQERLRALSTVLFWGLGLVALFSGELVYELFPSIRPAHSTEIFAASMSGVAILGVTKRIVLGRPCSILVLDTVDACIAAGAGTGIAASALFAPELRAAGYTALLLSIFVVITRAIVVPSTRARTAFTSTLTFVPIVGAACVLAWTHDEDIPGPAFVVGAFVLSATAGVLAATGSSVMYGLRRQADVATRLGQYTLDGKIGEGGMGVVYRAHHALLRRPTAIKLLAPARAGVETIDRFEREVRHTSQLTHPNTVAVFDYGRSTDGTFYYAMEYLDGLDLEELVRRHGAQPPGRVVRLLVQVCGALQEAHDRGIIHRDIKPANIIACVRGEVPDVAKVVDFGLAKEIAAEPGASAHTVLGTPAYLAPEVITEPSAVGPASDLYAVGGVGYYLLTGRRLFEGPTALAVCLHHVNTPAPTVAAPSALADVIARCLVKQPRARYASAAELATALRDADPGDWGESDAALWWRDRSARHAAASTQPTHTITIQLTGRR